VSLDDSSAEPASCPLFWPATCHPPLGRREFLIGTGAAVAAAVSGPLGASAGDLGKAVIEKHAGLPRDPWAVCHGIRALGRDFKIRDGRRAVDFLLETHLASVPVNGKVALAFPEAVEVHPNMFLKTMLEAGVPLDYGFSHQGGRRTLRDVVDGARALLRPSQVAGTANALPWSIIALVRVTSPLTPRWTNAWGEPVDLDLIVEGALRLYERASAPLAQAMQSGRGEAVKAPVHDLTCGGMHMFYALLAAMQAGFVGPDRAERMRRQVDLVVWRLSADTELIGRFYAERAREPGARWYEVGAKTKLLGHAEECLAFGATRRVVSLTDAQQAERRAAVATLRALIEEVEAKNLVEARKVNAELYRQLVGDLCHAHRGLVLA
jgi:hypothetical protein